jgi:hypothetical protein
MDREALYMLAEPIFSLIFFGLLEIYGAKTGSQSTLQVKMARY